MSCGPTEVSASLRPARRAISVDLLPEDLLERARRQQLVLARAHPRACLVAEAGALDRSTTRRGRRHHRRHRRARRGAPDRGCHEPTAGAFPSEARGRIAAAIRRIASTTGMSAVRTRLMSRPSLLAAAADGDGSKRPTTRELTEQIVE
jgi:hypothetical protein